VPEPGLTRLRLAGHEVQAALSWPSRPRGVVVLAHGRINDLGHPSLVAAALGAAGAGWACLRFNFPYRQRGEEEPDPFEVLTAVHGAAAEWACGELKPEVRRLVLAGKSLGARTAAAAALKLEPAGLIFLGFPLHPPRQPERASDRPLHGLSQPLLFVQGERDPLCRLEVLEGLIPGLRSPVSLKVIPQANHSFETPPGAEPRPWQVLQAIQTAAAGFLGSLNQAQF